MLSFYLSMVETDDERENMRIDEYDTHFFALAKNIENAPYTLENRYEITYVLIILLYFRELKTIPSKKCSSIIVSKIAYIYLTIWLKGSYYYYRR